MESLANVVDRQAMLGRMGNLRPEIPRQWGKMSAHQMVCHLCDSFRGVMGDRALSGKRFPLGGVIKWVALYVPLKWSRNMPTMPEVDQMKLGTAPVEFRSDVEELGRLMERFSNVPRDFNWRAHPFFGEMSDKDWMRWGWLHMDHHFRQFGE